MGNTMRRRLIPAALVCCLLTSFLTGIGSKAQTAQAGETMTPILKYDFEEVNGDIVDKAGSNNPTVHGTCSIINDSTSGRNVLSLSGKNGSYVELPKGFFDGMDTFTLSMDVYTMMDDQNFFTFTLGKNDQKYLFLRTRQGDSRVAISVDSWGNERDVSGVKKFKNNWVNITLVVKGTYMALFFDGEMVSENKNTGLTISDLGSNLIAYIGKSFYGADSYFKGYIDNFTIYKEALTASQVAEMNGVETLPFNNVVCAEAYIVKWLADYDTKTVDIWFSKSKSTEDQLKKSIVTFRLNEGVKGSDGDTLTITDLQETTKTFIVEKEDFDDIQKWTVKPHLAANPVLKGQFADPDIDAFGDYYYMYTTTDGFDGWGGYEFHCFKSANLVDWEDCGVILNVKSAQVPWAVGNAWAPTIEEKNGKYYFYFCAKRQNGDSCIGVAVADAPEGPYTATSEPLLTPEQVKATGCACGQTIDPSIFTDEDGSSYMLFGNGAPTIIKMNDDMVSVDWSTCKNYKGAHDFREAITATKRDGVYHFTWSCDDTGSPKYHVNYGTSDSIYGPIDFKYTILEADSDMGILGTGHHCMLQIPGQDEYYIAYHRFFTPIGYYTGAYGIHRETCIDKVEFDASTGLMKVVKPTLEGVSERYLKDNGQTTTPGTDEKQPASDGKSVSKGLLAGIVAGVVAIAAVIILIFRKKK